MGAGNLSVSVITASSHHGSDEFTMLIIVIADLLVLDFVSSYNRRLVAWSDASSFPFRKADAPTQRRIGPQTKLFRRAYTGHAS
jgi:hypothetical protein